MWRIRIAALTAAVVLVSSCGGDDSSDGAEPSDTSGATAASAGTSTLPDDVDSDDTEAADQGGATTAPTGDDETDRCTADHESNDLKMAVFSETRGLDPVISAGGGVAGGTELTALYDRLARWNPDTGAYEPWLAKSFESNDDFTTWTVNLRPGVTFGNGDPLTADAVKASIERFKDPAFASHYGAIVDLMTSIDVVDDLTLRFTLDEPWPGFGYLLAGQTGMIVNTKVVDEVGAEAFNNDPTGAGVGPFEFENWALGESLTMSGRDDYWGGPVCIDSLEFVPMSSAQTMADALDTQEIQVAFLREPAVVEEAREAGVDGYTNLQNGGQILLLNNRPNAATSDVRIRRALTMAIDTEQVDERANRGTGLPGGALIHPESINDSGVDPLPYDPDAAKALVDEVKAEGEWDGAVELLCDSSQNAMDRAVAIEGMLEAAGFTVERETAPITNVIQKVTIESDFEIACYGFSIADGVLWPNLDRKIRGGASGNSMGLDNDVIDQAIADLRRAESPEDETALMGKIQEEWNDVAPTIILSAVAEYIAWTDDVHGVLPTIEGIVFLGEAYVE